MYTHNRVVSDREYSMTIINIDISIPVTVYLDRSNAGAITLTEGVRQ
jgi:hypothetical protein